MHLMVSFQPDCVILGKTILQETTRINQASMQGKKILWHGTKSVSYHVISKGMYKGLNVHNMNNVNDVKIQTELRKYLFLYFTFVCVVCVITWGWVSISEKYEDGCWACSGMGIQHSSSFQHCFIDVRGWNDTKKEKVLFLTLCCQPSTCQIVPLYLHYL